MAYVFLRDFTEMCMTLRDATSPRSPVMLSASDYEAVLAGTSQLHRHRDPVTLPGIALDLLSAVVPNAFCTYSEFDRGTRKLRLVARPVEMQRTAERFVPVIARHLHRHPLWPQVGPAGEGRAWTTLDCISIEELRAREFYTEALALLAVEDTLAFSIGAGTASIVVFTLSRREPAFTARDKKVADLFRPHLVQAFESAQAFSAAAGISAHCSRGHARLAQGVALANARGDVVHGNSLAAELLARYFPARAPGCIRLPGAVHRWVFAVPPDLSAPRLPFELIAGDKKLSIRQAATGDAHWLLILEEQRHSGPQMLRPLGLTPRECDVLFWVAQGKGNWDIGVILALSHRTVEKHLQAIFHKLGVESRTGALLRTVPLLNN